MDRAGGGHLGVAMAAPAMPHLEVGGRGPESERHLQIVGAAAAGLGSAGCGGEPVGPPPGSEEFKAGKEEREEIIQALLQSEWVLFCPGEPKEPCFQGGKAHFARFETVSRRLASPGEQELLLLFKTFKINNNIVPRRFTACQRLSGNISWQRQRLMSYPRSSMRRIS